MTGDNRILYLAADHGGWGKKNSLVRLLRHDGWQIVDLSPRRPATTDDYPRWALQAARRVSRRPQDRAILFCRTGVGMAMAANKVKHIRAVQGWSVAVARRSRQDENTNILSLAADFHSVRTLALIARAWLTTPFRPISRHQRRLRQVAALDHGR